MSRQAKAKRKGEQSKLHLNFKYIYSHHTKEEWFYDLEKDPFEKNNTPEKFKRVFSFKRKISEYSKDTSHFGTISRLNNRGGGNSKLRVVA